MSESTKTPKCVNCGIQIVSTGDGYMHVPLMEDPLTDCADPTPIQDGGDEMWQMAVWIKPGAAPMVCDQIRELDGVAELYRAYRPGYRG